jgi:hypothetical protein
MKLSKLFTALFVLSVLVIAAGFPVVVAQAAPASFPVFQEAPPPPPVDFSSLLATLTSLAGAGALIAALVNIGKATGIVKDGTAPTWSAGLNIAVLIGLFVAQVFGYSNLVPAIDTQAGEAATVIQVVLAFIVQALAARKTHESVLAGLPAIGKSHSLRMAGESNSVVEMYQG